MDINKHKINLTNILIDIYKDSSLSPILGFKGGTAAMLFYGLPRFSVDLDFDLLTSEIDINKITKLLSKNFEIKDQSDKFNTLFWLLSYEKGEHHIKVEISRRDNSYNTYNKRSFYGTTIQVLDIKDMIAHKMVALTERSQIATRDMFDIHYFLGTPNASKINYEVIKIRTGLTPSEFYKKLLTFIDSVNPNKILEGLGEVLTDPQKDWVKAKLLVELKDLIKRQIEFAT